MANRSPLDRAEFRNSQLHFKEKTQMTCPASASGRPAGVPGRSFTLTVKLSCSKWIPSFPNGKFTGTVKLSFFLHGNRFPEWGPWFPERGTFLTGEIEFRCKDTFGAL